MKIKFYIAIFLLIFMSYYCNSDSSTEYIKLVSANDRVSGELTSENFDNLVMDNHIGEINIIGSSTPGPIRYFMSKVVYAKTEAKAKSHFDEINIEHSVHDDSLKCSITAPENSDYVKYFCDLSLIISSKLPVYIELPNNGFQVSQMDTVLYVMDSNGSIEVKKHNGSCDVKTSMGDIFIEISLKRNGFCQCFTSDGKIVVNISTTSSATIFAKTNSGTISYTDLIIDDLVESGGTLTGKIGEGKGEIHLETLKGDIEMVGFDTM